MKHILMLSSEALPFSKTGGLADVVYSLSKELVLLGNEVSVVVPFYGNKDYSKTNLSYFGDVGVSIKGWNTGAGILTGKYNGITYYFIDHEYYFKRDKMYGYYDDGERFAFFDNAVIELIKKYNLQVDVLHCHDWQTGMMPCLIKCKYYNDPQISRIKTVFTIHNPLFKGYFDVSSLYSFFGLNVDLFYNGSVRLENMVSTLKAGIKFADKITTVSPTHAYELTTPEGSFGLSYDIILRQNDFVGILNGMDYGEFNPSDDHLIYKMYGVKDLGSGKFANKKAFCEEHHLDPNLPLFAVVSRLTDQKGLDLMTQMAEYVTSSGGNFAVLGSGEKGAEDYFNNLYSRKPNNVMVYIGYNDTIAHQLYASSDFFIMPSKFEPCGLGQMIAQRYGSLPIVRSTGGLADSVYGYDFNNPDSSKISDGLAFFNYSTYDAIKTCSDAFRVYYNHSLFETLRLNAFKDDHTWKKSALTYLDLYNSLC